MNLRPLLLRRINIGEDYEVTYWAKAFGVSEQELIDVVSRVGEEVENVRRELQPGRLLRADLKE
jgi:hypothetical protein